MNSKFKYNPPFKYEDMESETFPDGKRIYHTPSGIAPSVTTILASLPNPGIDEWRKKVGEEEAQRVSKEATTIGSYMHDYLENYLLGEVEETPKDELQVMAHRMYKSMTMFGLNRLDEIWGIESALHCHDLYAGRTDLLGVYQKKPSIIDYKTSKRPKPAAWIHHYKLQTAAYSVAHSEMTGFDINQGVILIAIRPNWQGRSEVQKFIIEEDEFQELKVEWLGIVEDYYTTRG